MGQKAISSNSRLDTVKPKALKILEGMGTGVGMETPASEGRSRETDQKLRKVDCKILRKEKSVKREGGLLKS